MCVRDSIAMYCRHAVQYQRIVSEQLDADKTLPRMNSDGIAINELTYKGGEATPCVMKSPSARPFVEWSTAFGCNPADASAVESVRQV